MQNSVSQRIGRLLNIKQHQVENSLQLLAEGASIPFIARYRKEATGSLDEVALTQIRDHAQRLSDLEKRRTAIISTLKANKVLSAPLLDQLEAAETLTTLEDIYLPYRPKRRTKATVARDRGLQPLAEKLFTHPQKRVSIDTFISLDTGIHTEAEALAGARDIIAETISENHQIRGGLRSIFASKAMLRSRLIAADRDGKGKFKDYHDWQEPVRRIAGHRYLAVNRGESEGILRVSCKPDEQLCLDYLYRRYLKHSLYREQIRLAIEDSYKRLLCPSLENELRKQLKAVADSEAIAVFTSNLKELLLTPPLGAKRVLAVDPGFRTGAKLACLDVDGSFLESATIYPTHGQSEKKQAAEILHNLVSRNNIAAIAIGSGTAGRETERFIRQLSFPTHPVITLVNEDGASIYSASDSARNEFPALDITVRGAISIGRRLQDPLAELVKIDPKSIGVGQYQHDVDQAALRKSLDDTVTSCVNHVGVELNTASAEILSYVSGLGPVLAKNIIQYRQKHGPFGNRQELLKVSRLGKRAFKLAAGFLRIRGGGNPLDESGVHPERYELVYKIARDHNTSVETLMKDAKLRELIDLNRYISEDIGLPTLNDIHAELEKPGRDPRIAFHPFAFSEAVHAIEDLEVGMKLPAVITNVTRFGAFADIGIHQDGLIHISQLAEHYVKDPAEIVRVQQQVTVRVIEVDTQRGRIALSLKKV